MPAINDTRFYEYIIMIRHVTRLKDEIHISSTFLFVGVRNCTRLQLCAASIGLTPFGLSGDWCLASHVTEPIAIYRQKNTALQRETAARGSTTREISCQWCSNFHLTVRNNRFAPCRFAPMCPARIPLSNTHEYICDFLAGTTLTSSEHSQFILFFLAKCPAHSQVYC